ncbi:MAG: hypothetical protein II505_00105 [Bacteroidaceae bacterium]|nr:hypothetical protein [Bacteroidaceae bacterium]
MKVTVEGANIQCFVDNMEKPLIDYTDPKPFITGRAGFRTHSSVIRFDNFVVTPKAKDASAVAPLSFPEATTPRIYNMQGLPMPIGKPLPHGIYIVNGKKMAY